MARLPITVTCVAFVTAAGVCIGCGADTSSQERADDTAARVSGSPPVVADVGASEAPAVVAVPDNPADKAIRRELNLAIARDADLKTRRISFIVANGDVSVNGTVGSEEERKRLNDLAMNVPGVKSVANALLIAQ
jgi:osmotically-inducible protein OsmY